MATIYVGVKALKNRDDRSGHVPLFWKRKARWLLQKHVDCIGLCVTFTPTTFIYTKGNEPGFSVGLINYPRFPSTRLDIRQHALAIGYLMLREFKQFKVSIVFPDETVMLEPK
jgi:hypothetical protein